MEDPNVPEALAFARASTGCELDEDDVTYFLGRETLIVTKRRAWRCGASSCSC